MTDMANEPKDGNAEIDLVALPAGSKIGRYEVVAILGEGGFGITYRARDLELDREVAVKEYLPSALAVRKDGVTVLPRSTKTADDFVWARERFVAEGRTLASLHRAPAIVRVFDFLQANGTAYIVMELLNGETLEKRLKIGGPLKPEAMDRILWPILDGLEQVHGAGFLHRDIKPANILLDPAGNPTLIDFGAARAAVAGGTQAMTAVFTPGYAAAEQFTSAKQGPWTDIYGLAATLYHAIVGKPPPNSFDRMLDDAYEPLAKIAPAGFAPGLLIGIDAGLAVRASDRPQSIAGWRAILGRTSSPSVEATVALSRDGGPTFAVARPQPPTLSAPTLSAPSAARRLGLWVGAAIVVLLLIGGSYYAATKSAREATVAAEEAQKAREELAAADAARRRNEEERARLRADAAARDKAAADAAERRQRDDEARRKIAAEQVEAQRKAEAEIRSAARTAPAPAPAAVPANPNAALAPPKSGPDGIWRGLMHCTASPNGVELNIPVVINISGGTGTWTRPGSGPNTIGNHSVSVTVNGGQVLVSRVFVLGNAKEPRTAHMAAVYDGKNTISGAGPERNGGGRTCDIALSRGS